MGWFSRKSVSAKQWRREPGDIASRVEAADVKRDCVNHPFVVYDGTIALLIQQGRLLGELAAGKHDLDGPLRKWLIGDDPTVLILTDAGDIVVDASVTGLYSVENIGLDVDLRLTLTMASPETFWLNVMKDRRRYTISDFVEHQRPEFHEVLLAFTSTRPIEDLYHNPALRAQMEQALRERAGARLDRLGLALASLNVARVSSQQYDPLREQGAGALLEDRKATIETTRLKVLQRVRENLATDRQHESITESELRDAVQQATHELGIKESLRDDELASLNARLEQDAADYGQQRLQSREADQVKHDLGLDAAKKEHKRQQESLDIDTFLATRLKQTKADEDVRDLERQGEEKDWKLAREMRDEALAARKRMKIDDVDVEAARIESLAKADTATKVALGLGDQETLLELERLEKQQSMSPEQLIVLAAEKSEAAAMALAERFKSEGRVNDEMMDLLRQQVDRERLSNRESADRLERILRESLQQMGKVASAKAESQGPGDQTIVTGGMGGGTVINPKPDSDGDDPPEPR